MAEAGGSPGESGVDGRDEPLPGVHQGAGSGPQRGPSPAAQGIGDPALPAPHNMACTFLAASVARRKKWGWEGGTQARGGCWAGETAFGTHFGVPSPGCPTPGPPPGTVCGGGLLWIQWTPALPRVPEALLVCPPRPWWRVCGSAGAPLLCLLWPWWRICGSAGAPLLCPPPHWYRVCRSAGASLLCLPRPWWRVCGSVALPGQCSHLLVGV